MISNSVSNTFPALVVVAALVVLAGCCEEPVNVDLEKIELLEIHLADIRAHKNLDVEGLLTGIGPDLRSIRDGEISILTRRELKEQFTAHFSGARYEVFEDQQVPHAEISDDGTMGWVISRIGVRRIEPDGTGGERTEEFVCAGIITYKKVRGRWQKTADVSTFTP